VERALQALEAAALRTIETFEAQQVDVSCENVRHRCFV
jgi:hypothetical protein